MFDSDSDSTDSPSSHNDPITSSVIIPCELADEGSLKNAFAKLLELTPHAPNRYAAWLPVCFHRLELELELELLLLLLV